MHSIEISHTKSSRKQICRECHREIPAGEALIKTTEIKKGAVSFRKTSYLCQSCDMGITLKKGDERA